MNTIYSGNLVYIVCDSLNLNKATVKPVIDEYVNLLVEEIKLGNTVSFLGIATIRGKVERSFQPMGYHFSLVSERLGLDYDLVRSILLAYEEQIKDCVLSQYRVVIYGLAKFWLSDKGSINSKSSSRFCDIGLSVRVSLNPVWKLEAKAFS